MTNPRFIKIKDLSTKINTLDQNNNLQKIIPILTNNNYSEWKIIMIICLKKRQLYQYCTKECVPGDGEIDEVCQISELRRNDSCEPIGPCVEELQTQELIPNAGRELPCEMVMAYVEMRQTRQIIPSCVRQSSAEGIVAQIERAKAREERCEQG